MRTEPSVGPGRLASGLLLAQLLGAMVDFGALGLASQSGFDTGKWLLLSPGLFMGLYLLVASPTVMRWILSGPMFIFMVWFAWAFASAGWSIDAQATVLQLVSAVAVTISAFWYVRSFGRSSFARVFSIAAAVVLTVGLANDLIPAVADVLGVEGSQTEFGVETGRSPGITPGVNQLGMLAGLTMMMLVRVAPRTEAEKLARLVGFALAGTAMFTAGSRSVAVCTIVALAVQVGMGSSIQSRVRGAVGAVAATLVAVGFIGTSGTETTFQAGRSFDSLNGRENVWSHAIELIGAEPLIGYGMMTGQETWARAFALGRTTFDAGDAHNTALELLVGTGIVGLSLFAAAMVWAALRAWNRRDSDALALILLLGFVGLTEALVSAPGLVYSIFGVIMGLVAAEATVTQWPDGRGGSPERLLGQERAGQLAGVGR